MDAALNVAGILLQVFGYIAAVVFGVLILAVVFIRAVIRAFDERDCAGSVAGGFEISERERALDSGEARGRAGLGERPSGDGAPRERRNVCRPHDRGFW